MKEKLRKITNNIKDVFSLLWMLKWLLLMAIITILINYMIATSNLPDWFKFWLLK